MAKTKRLKGTGSRSSDGIPSRLHTRVVFEFYNMETAREFIGSVSVSGDAMTLEIPEQPGTQHCLVKGSRKGHLFQGRNSFRELEPVEVDATWCDVGDGYLCLWIEEGTEYVVRFSLPR